LVSAAVLVSALALGGLAVAIPLFVQDQKPVFMLFGFEAVVVVAATLGVLFGLGRFGDGPGLAMACISATVLVASALGWLSANRALAGHSITPVLGFRVLAAFLLGGLGAVCVLSRHGRSWRLAAWGIGLGLPCIAAALAGANGGSRRAIEGALGRAGALGTVGGILAVLVLGALLCASVHLIIRAFELGRVEAKPESPPAR
jgi:hypothetical protein